MVNSMSLDGAWKLASSDGRRNRFGYAHRIDDDRAWLVFEQLDLDAVIHLNGAVGGRG